MLLDAKDVRRRASVPSPQPSRKAFVLGQVGRYDEAIASYDEGINRDKDTSDPTLQEQVARALLNKGYLLNQAGRLGDAIASYEKAIETAEKVIGAANAPDESPLRGAIGRALIGKAFLLSKTGDWQRAIGTYDEAIARSTEKLTALSK